MAKMDTLLNAESVRERLKELTIKQLERLSELSGVPVPTIYKIRLGVTGNPGIETVGQFWPFIDRALKKTKATA